MTVSDQFPVTQILPPGIQGPPAPDYANVTYVDDFRIQSWMLEIRTWDIGYVPHSSQDTGGNAVGQQLDSSNSDNAGKTQQFRPYDYVYNIYKNAGTAYFCFHNLAFDLDGHPHEAYTGPQSLQYHGRS